MNLKIYKQMWKINRILQSFCRVSAIHLRKLHLHTMLAKHEVEKEKKRETERDVENK